MKNIVIIGPPRSGKTTLAKMIVKRINGYSLISSDNLRTSFVSATEKSEIKRKNSNIQIYLDIPREQCYEYLRQSTYYESDLGYVVDFSCYDEELFKKFSEEAIVIFLGYSSLTKEQLFKSIRENDTENEWTYIESNYSLNELCKNFIEQSKKFEEYAKKNNCWYVDTSKDRKKTLEATFKTIKKILDSSMKNLIIREEER